tara:strand:+ start:1306 stop:1518 length:213 start_codon:yes stop_codon:yes gene_type:complete
MRMSIIEDAEAGGTRALQAIEREAEVKQLQGTVFQLRMDLCDNQEISCELEAANNLGGAIMWAAFMGRYT